MACIIILLNSLFEAVKTTCVKAGAASGIRLNQMPRSTDRNHDINYLEEPTTNKKMKNQKHNKLTRGVLAVVAGASLMSISAMAQIPYPNAYTIIPNSAAQVLVAGNTNVIVTYYHGISGGDHDILYLGGIEIFDNKINNPGDQRDLGIFTPGTILQFTMTDFGNNDTVMATNSWNMGSGVGNTDGHVHAYVTSDGTDGNGSPVTYVGWEDDTTGQPYVDWNYNDLTFTFSSATFQPVPEPTTLALAALGGASLLLLRRRK